MTSAAAAIAKREPTIEMHLVSARKALKKALVAKGYTVSEDTGSSMSIDGVFVEVEAKKDHARRGYERGSVSGGPTGRGRILAGNYPKKHQFPLRKDGSFDLDAAVAYIEQTVTRRKEEDARKTTNRQVEWCAVELRTEIVRKVYKDPMPSKWYDADGNDRSMLVPQPSDRVQLTATKEGLGLTIAGGLNWDQAMAVLKTCKALGLIG
jgi:hypothetical protein